jgi:hypothetical protein
MLHNITGLIPDGADEDGAPEHAAVLAAETNFKTAFGTVSERRLDLRHCHIIGGTRRYCHRFSKPSRAMPCTRRRKKCADGS